MASGLRQLLVEPPDDFLLLPDREGRVFGVPFLVSSLNEGNAVPGGVDLCEDHLTLIQSQWASIESAG